VQNCWHTATCYFLPTVSKNGKIVFFQSYEDWSSKSWVAAVVNSQCPQGSRMWIQTALMKCLKIWKMMGCTGQQDPPQTDPHLGSELWHIVLKKCTPKTYRKKTKTLKHHHSQNNFLPSFFKKSNQLFTTV